MYCSFIFNSGKKTKVDKIDKIQSKCLRIIEYCSYKKQREDEAQLCATYNICNLQQRREVQLGSIMYRYSRNEKCIDMNVNRENLRSTNKI